MVSSSALAVARRPPRRSDATRAAQRALLMFLSAGTGCGYIAPSGASQSQPRDRRALEADGYVVLTALLTRAQLDEIRRGVTPLRDRSGRNAFEGNRTQRVYSVRAKTWGL